MSSAIESIINTRGLASQVLAKSLEGLENFSEFELKEKILEEVKKNSTIYPEGWYSPPPDGIAVVFSEKPYDRLKYESLRNEPYWPKPDLKVNKETVGMVHISPVNRQTNLFGDIGFTFYRGGEEKIKRHLENSYKAILKIAEFAQVGKSFSQICEFALNEYKNKFKPTRWVTVSSNPDYEINLGHTVPGSFETNLTFGGSFQEIKETIRTNRVHLVNGEKFIIPETCAFTVESRIEDYNDPSLPSAYFHFIVCFQGGKKTILENFNEIFKVLGMDYMNSK